MASIASVSSCFQTGCSSSSFQDLLVPVVDITNKAIAIIRGSAQEASIDFQTYLKTAVQAEDITVMKTLVSDALFEKISSQSLVETLQIAARYNSICIQQLKDHPKFKDISAKELAEILKIAAEQRSFYITRVLINTLKFKDVCKQDLIEIFKIAARRNTIQDLMDSPRFKTIPAKSLGEILKIAAQNNSLDAAQGLLSSFRGKDILPSDIGDVLKFAAKQAAYTLLNGLIKNPKFKDIAIVDIKEAMRLFFLNTLHEKISSILVQSSSFKNAVRKDIEEIFINSAVYKIHDILNLLFHPTRLVDCMHNTWILLKFDTFFGKELMKKIFFTIAAAIPDKQALLDEYLGKVLVRAKAQRLVHLSTTIQSYLKDRSLWKR